MTSADRILAALDPQQRQVAQAFDGPVAVIAGAGTGKTRAITHRIAYGALTGAIDPATTLAVTFSNRAAGELKARLRALDVPRAQARTFHSAALRMLTWFWPRAYGSELPQLASNNYGLLSEAISAVGIEPNTALVRDIGTEVSWTKVSNIPLGDYPSLAAAHHRVVATVDTASVVKILAAYEEAKRRRDVIDFDDILLLTVAMLSEHDDIAAEIRSRYRHFVVDEFQDMSPLQNTLLELWVAGRDSICVVGDPNQSIHGFAGADPRYLLEFPRRHPGTTIVRLVRDYRSTPQVVAVANTIASARPDRALQAQRPAGPDVTFVGSDAEGDEAAAIAAWLKDLNERGVPWREMAVLYRINAMSPTLEAALTQAGIPYLVKGSERFYERSEIRQALAALNAQAKAVASDETASAYESVLAVVSAQGWTSDPPEGAGRVRERWESLSALVSLAHDLCEESPEITFAEVVELMNRRAEDQQVPTANGVTLATMHASKGLEWEAVALFGMQDGTLPFSLSVSGDEIREEKRLLYVGVTRAKEHLRVSWSTGRSGPGKRRPSRFLTPFLPKNPTPAPAKRRSLQAMTCRVCHQGLHAPDERKLGRHRDCNPTYNEELLDALKAWRLEVARENSQPAFVVFTDATLIQIAEVMPGTPQELLQIAGVGHTKLGRFGADVLAIVADYR